MSRFQIVVLSALALLVVGLFMVAAALDPPARLKYPPATATPRGGAATAPPR